MSLAQSLYDRRRKLLALSCECREPEIAGPMRAIAYALLEMAYGQDAIEDGPADEASPARTLS